MDCIFCKIAAKEISSEIVKENDRMVAFRDIHPKAPVHLLVIPRAHRASLEEVTKEDRELLGEALLFTQDVARAEGLAQKGYKVVMNVGRGGGQIIDHLHIHILGGWENKPQKVDV